MQAGQSRAESWVIAAPQRCWRPRPYTEEGAADWGMAAQLYGLRSATNIGIGTYADAGEAAREAGLRGAAFLGLSPVHALFGSDRTKISPYSPSSRLFLETLFIAPRSLPGLAGSRAEALLAERAEAITALREAALVDHQGVADVLDPVLRALWADSSARAGTDAEFAQFRQAGGEDLESHAVFEALSEHFRGQGAHWLGDWPEAYRRAGTEAVRGFAAEHDEAVRYHAWLQYLADRQLAAASAAALGAGMRVGLYRDLAVGADRGGSEIWSHPERFADRVSIGAPPDLLAPKGQNWGLPAFDPLAMERDGLRPSGPWSRPTCAMRARSGSTMPSSSRACSSSRWGRGPRPAPTWRCRLSRCWRCCGWRATATSASSSRRISAPPRGLLGRADARRRAQLPDPRLRARGRRTVQGPVGLPAGRAHRHHRPRPADVRRLVARGRHRHPPVAGPLRPGAAEAERAERVVERRRLAEALAGEQLLPSAEPPDAAPFEAAARYLARAPSMLTAVQYEDMVSELAQANVPGSTEGYPNWRRKLDRELADIAAPGGPLAKLAASLSAEARGPRSGAARLATPAPRSTYRLQFHKDFTFADACRIVPYLHRLGISHVYASPLQKARPGSTHGYDIVDHGAINPELGGEDGFVALSETLQAHG